MENKIVTGLTKISLKKGGRALRCYYSDSIKHGLGEGCVKLTFAVEESYFDISKGQRGNHLLFGNLEVFREHTYVPQIPEHALGCKVDIQDGSFIIGIKLRNNTKLTEIPIRWWAEKTKSVESVNEYSHNTIQTSEQGVFITIKNIPKQLKQQQTHQFEVEVDHTDNKDVIWEVVGERAGKIDEEGVYTAPDRSGIFKIKAISKADQSISAEIFIIIN